MEDHHADDLLRRALIEPDASAAVALKVAGLPLCEAVTVVFHGRRDLSTIQTYVTHGARGAGDAVAASELLRVPCDLDLAGAEDREEAERILARALDATVMLEPDPAALSVPVTDAERAAEAIGELARADVTVAGFAVGQPSLDEVFLSLTGHPAEETEEPELAEEAA